MKKISIGQIKKIFIDNIIPEQAFGRLILEDITAFIPQAKRLKSIA